MKLNEWREKRQTTLTLPSGLEVKVKRISLLDLVGSGKIPNTLYGMVKKVDSGKVKLEPEALQELGPLLNAVAVGCLVEPAIADTADETHIGVDELPFEDKLFLFQWSNEEAKRLAPFRGEQAGDLGAVPGGDDIQQPTEHDPARAG